MDALKYEFKNHSLKQIIQKCREEFENFLPRSIGIEDISPMMDCMNISETNSDNSNYEQLKDTQYQLFKDLRTLDDHPRKKRGWITHEYY